MTREELIELKRGAEEGESPGREWRCETIRGLLEEIERLKEGRFSPEELQDLCHNLSEEQEADFKAGCEEYQKKIFGTGAVEEAIRKSIEERDWEWWSKLALVDSVAPTPEGVLSWQVSLTELAVREEKKRYERLWKAVEALPQSYLDDVVDRIADGGKIAEGEE